MAEPIRYTLRMVAERAAFEPYWVGISRETARDMLARIRALEADVAILRAEIARKDEALRPFAALGVRYAAFKAEDFVEVAAEVADLHRARACLATMYRERGDAMTTHPDSDRRG